MTYIHQHTCLKPIKITLAVFLIHQRNMSPETHHEHPCVLCLVFVHAACVKYENMHF
jgi:hypothetical protein